MKVLHILLSDIRKHIGSLGSGMGNRTGHDERAIGIAGRKTEII